MLTMSIVGGIEMMEASRILPVLDYTPEVALATATLREKVRPVIPEIGRAHV